MTLAELLTAYHQLRDARLRDKDELPTMRLESVQILSTTIRGDPMRPGDGVAELERLITDFAPDRGWLCYQSEVTRVTGGQWTRADTSRGLLLSGELVNQADESLHIRQDGRGGWLTTRFAPGQGEEYLVDEHQLIAHERDPDRRSYPGRLHYRRYWCLDPQHGVRQAAARFIGFDEGH